MPDRPNVLVVTTDQQSVGTLSAAGHPDIETPAMDRIAARGTRFTNAYCTEPLCLPSRASMYTGRMPHEVRPHLGQESFDGPYSEQQLGHLFSAAGYDCGYAGKWHVPQFAMPEGNGFDPLCGFDDTAVADASIDFLDRERSAPFLLVASFDDPHNICEWSRNQNLPWGEVDDAPPAECPDLPTNFAIPPYEPAEIRPTIADNRWALGSMVDATPDQWRQYRHAYFRLVERVDARIGRILDALEERGLWEDTVIVFTSDHGDGQGAHQITQKTWLYEEEIGVPFLVSAPDGPDGAVADDLVSVGLDFVPTLCDYADVDAPADLRGRSVRSIVGGASPEDWRDQVVVQTFGPLEGRAVRTERYKYIVYDYGDEREQLFDLDDDPGELVDRSHTADYAAVLDEHRERLFEWCRATDDHLGEPWDYPIVPRIPGYDRLDIRDEFDGPSRFDL
jgi:arylsulfatase A-like enzyme